MENKIKQNNKKTKQKNSYINQIVYIDKKLVQKVKCAKATKEEEEELLSKL
ncbi:hypothetical protein [Malaciobacter molluscorum]|uniref:hypothetical protein n=1 Tax=Malaciobacter molluscorum TaxID=1032072 RepID=UPI0013E99951|nr:hypothetical protein [Malaciobacter molluscorum]